MSTTKQDKPDKSAEETAAPTPTKQGLQTFYFPEQDVKVEAATLEEATKKAKLERREKEDK